MKRLESRYDVVVCGGGLAGFCAAVAAARHGARTCLIQDRPVFGGNSSSEVRVTPHGAAAFHAYARETGIVSELLIEERARNHAVIYENGWTNSVWDLTLYDAAMAEPNLTFHLNTSVAAVRKWDDRNIEAVVCRTANAEVERIIHGRIFIDATGDGLVAAEAGCEWRMGSEGRDEFGEPHAPEHASADTMGNSIHFQARDMGRPVPYRAPEWAVHHEDASYFYEQGRIPRDVRGGFWWIEIGVPWHTIHDAEDIRHELTRHALGVWDWMKNRDPRTRDKAANFALDWIGQVPGKRESRRIMGRYLMTEHDPQNATVFDDEIAFGGWFVDAHTPGGLLAKSSEPASAEEYRETSSYAVKSYCGPYGIPLRMLIAKDMDNLMMAGRNVSATHAALATVRVMGTTALMGQAAGTAAATAVRENVPLAETPCSRTVSRIRQMLLRDGCFLPNARNEDPDDLALEATVRSSSEALLYGAGPESRGEHEGMHIWMDQARPVMEALEYRRGQWIAVGSDRIDSLSVCLSNPTPAAQRVGAVIVPVEHIWDYRSEPAPPLAAGLLTVPPGPRQWVGWEVNLRGLTPGRYVRLDLMANPAVEWHVAGRIEPGHVAAFEMAPGKMRRYGPGLTMSFQVEPPQPCFGPENVLSGVTRPHRFTNLWRSDPARPLEQWIELEWSEPRRIAQVELTFPGQLLREYHAYAPFYRDPQCPREYGISAACNGSWFELLRVRHNYQRHRRHRLAEPVTTSRLRVTVHATNGDPSAAIYEIRCYAGGNS